MGFTPRDVPRSKNALIYSNKLGLKKNLIRINKKDGYNNRLFYLLTMYSSTKNL